MAAPGAKLLQALQYVVIGAAIVHFLPRRFLFFLCAGAVMLVVSLVMGQEKILYHPTVPPDIKTIADNPVGYRSPKEHGIAHEDASRRVLAASMTTAGGVSYSVRILCPC